MSVLAKVKETVRDHELLQPGDSVLIALSGGPDSVALLHLLTKLRKPMELSLAAVYINHRIRRRAAAREERFCQELCDRFGIELDIVTEDIPALAKKRRTGLEETARDFRYEVFELLANEDNHDRIALGHHADDRVETVLFRILRGTGPSGLIGIPAKRGRVIRPLYDLTKEEIQDYLAKHGLDYCVDRSNAEIRYRRNYIRNRLLPAIRKNLNNRVDRALYGLSEIAASEDTYLQKLTLRAAKKAVSKTPAGKIELDLAVFGGYDVVVRRRLLRHCIKALSADSTAPDREVIERLDRFAADGGRAVSLPGRIEAVRVGARLVFRRKGSVRFDKRLEPGRPCRVERLSLTITCRTTRKRAGMPARKRRQRRVTLDWSKIKLPLRVRSIGPGDRFRPLGLGGSKKVGDYLTDRKVAPVYRDEIPLVCDRAGIVWVVGYEIDERVKIDSKTREVLVVEVDIGRQGAGSAV
jgi:tRNA(Ile)-lysidine synthase